MTHPNCIPEISPRQTAEGQFGGIGHCPPVISQNPAEAGHLCSFADDPIGFITEALIASEDAWSELPGLAPLLLREALAELEEVGA